MMSNSALGNRGSQIQQEPYVIADDTHSSPAIRIGIKSVSKQFNTRNKLVTALDNVNLSVPDGQFFMIVGPSGCGKTTLLRIMAGLDQPSSGTVEIKKGSESRPSNSMVFQGDSIFPWMTVFDNVAYGLRIRKVNQRVIRETVNDYLAKVGLTKFAEAYPHQLSGGMRQRVSIARAFANDPEILLMDEPFSALDEQNKTILQEELLRIWDETKKTVVYITHSVDEAVTLGDRVLVMSAHPGKVKAFIDVPFSRPRDVLGLRQQPEYGELVYDIWGHLREEVTKSQAAAAR